MSHSSDLEPLSQLSSPLSRIQAIPTWYGGVKFRSRLEARWAVFFTRIGHDDWVWEDQRYSAEPKTYLPDFYLPRLRLFVEIKPTMADLYAGPEFLDAFNLWQDFANKILDDGTHRRVAMFVGHIPNPDTVGVRGPVTAGGAWLSSPTIVTADEHDYAWCACPTGTHFDIALGADGSRIDCPCPRETAWVDWPCPTGNHPGILNAYGAARSERFEYGQGR